MVSLNRLVTTPIIALSMFSHGLVATECCRNVTSEDFKRQFIDKWLSFWNGDAALLNNLAAPDMVVYQDRVPSATGNGSDIVPMTSSEGLTQGMAYALAPYESFYFDLVAWAGTDNHLAVRWTLHGVLANSTTGR